LVFAGQTADAESFDRVVLDYREAFNQVRAALEQLDALLEKSEPVSVELMLRMAGLRERMGRIDEARAWRRLASSGTPSQPAARRVSRTPASRRLIPGIDK
jgi:hypothetical protein